MQGQPPDNNINNVPAPPPIAIPQQPVADQAQEESPVSPFPENLAPVVPAPESPVSPFPENLAPVVPAPESPVSPFPENVVLAPAPAPAPAPVKGTTTLPTLMKAIKEKNIEEIQKIINDPNNANILTRKTAKPKEASRIFNITALMAAVTTQNEQIVKMILDKIVDLNQQPIIGANDTSGKTAADYASILGLTNIATMIVEAAGKTSGAPIIVSKDVECRTPLHCALQSPANAEQFNKIIENEGYMKSLDKKVLFKAIVLAIQKYPENKEFYAKAIGDILDKVKQGKTGVRNIGDLWKSTTEIFKGSSESDADKRYTLFMYVAMTPGVYVKLMDVFLSRVPYAYITEKDVDGNTMLHHLAKTPDPGKLELLGYLKANYKYAPKIVNKQDQQPVFLAIQSNNTPIALELLKEFDEKSINYQDKLGNTLLIEATKTRNMPILELLNSFDNLKQDIRNKEGKKASDYVVQLGKLYTEPGAVKTLELASVPKFNIETIPSIDSIKYLFWNVRDISLCPVCLTKVDSNEGCIYLGHTCKTMTPIVHEELFNTLNDNGTIGWCKTCGDLAFNHAHFEYNEIGQPRGEKKAWTVDTPVFYQKNNNLTDSVCKAAGGLGYIQKYIRLYVLYNEICKIMKEIAEGKRITKREGKTRAISAMWNAAKPKIVNGVKMPNLDLLPRANEILNALQADYNPVFIQYRFTKPNGEETNNVNANTDSNEKIALVDTTFAQFNQPFACDLTNPQTATTPQEAAPVSNVGSTASNVGDTESNMGATEPNVANEVVPQTVGQASPAQSARNEELLENRRYLFNALEEKIKQGHLPPFQRDPNDMDRPGPNGETEKIEAIPEDEKNKCAFLFGGSHGDGRNLYKFTHVQPGTNKHIEHNEEQALYCAADLRSNIEDVFFNIPSDRYINPNEEPVIGVHCIFSRSCNGDIYPDQFNTIPSHELYLPTQLEPEIFSENEEEAKKIREAKGDEFKLKFNDLFTRNRVMYDYDTWAQEDISMQEGGAAEEDLITGISDFIQEGTAEVSCPLPPKQKAGIRIKTYRRKAGLRSVTRRV